MEYKKNPTTDNRIHVVHILPTLQFGGAERCVVDLVNHCDRNQFRFTILVLSNTKPMKEEITNTDVRIISLPKRGEVSMHLIRDIERALRDISPDLVHTHLFDVWGRIAAAHLRLPILTTEHNVTNGDGFLKCCIKRFLNNKSIEYTACSRAVQTDIENVYGITKPVTVIPYGIDLQRFAAVPPVRAHAPLRYVMIGRFTKQKGHDIAIRAFGRMQDLPWQLTIVGDGPLKKTLEDLVRSLGLTERVTILPSTHDIPSVFATHDVLLMPSRWEGLGIVIMEAMASGRLVIGSNTGGIPELIRHGETGYVVPHATPVAWERAVRQSITDWDAFRPVIERAEVYAKEHFGMQHMVDAYERIYVRLGRKQI